MSEFYIIFCTSITPGLLFLDRECYTDGVLYKCFLDTPQFKNTYVQFFRPVQLVILAVKVKKAWASMHNYSNDDDDDDDDV